ncbi:MAG: hypothetical protein AAFP82_05615, partial [Bacteroidota bacterium]
QQGKYEAAIAPIFQAYQIYERVGSPNAQTSGEYLMAIRDKIGEARFGEIIGALQAGEDSNTD